VSPQVKNPHLGPKLRKLGLTPETAFGCVTQFLFPPRPVIFAGVAAERRALLSGNGTLRIGIQARRCSCVLHYTWRWVGAQGTCWATVGQ